MEPKAIIDEVKASGLRGRGGAGFPTGMKWSFLPKNDEPRYLLCNADEGEPGTYKDRLMMERAPHQLIEGMIISAFTIKSLKSYIYIRGEYDDSNASIASKRSTKPTRPATSVKIFWVRALITTWTFTQELALTFAAKRRE